MSYTKLDDSGNVLANDAPSWAMVRDNVTGLIWENKTDDDSIHDKDNTYTWYDPTDPTPGNPGDGTDTKDFIDALNSSNFGNKSDWRLPTIKELSNIVKYDNPHEPIDSTYFPNTQNNFYWSSTSLADGGGAAWGAYFNTVFDVNNETTNMKGASYCVRAVRGGQPELSDHYVDNNDYTVTDKVTGLMWQQNTSDVTMLWDQALSYSESSTVAGFTDWRLPTKKELRSLSEFSRNNPAINPTYFSNTFSYWYWTSTSHAFSPYAAWMETFLDSYANPQNKSAVGLYVRAVRGGQSILSGKLIVLSPNQADSWDIGSQKVITWNTQSIEGDVKISISRDGGKTYTTIADAAPNNGSYSWTVSGPASVNCMMKIEPLTDLDKGTVQGLFTLFQVRGDVNVDGKADLADAILCLKVLSGFLPNHINPAADVNGDGKIGIAEAIYAMQKVAGL